MAQNQMPNGQGRSCPNCGASMEPDGELLRCPQHGHFFAYGPRLLVHVPRPEAAESPLMPWQTLSESVVR